MMAPGTQQRGGVPCYDGSGYPLLSLGRRDAPVRERGRERRLPTPEGGPPLDAILLKVRMDRRSEGKIMIQTKKSDSKRCSQLTFQAANEVHPTERDQQQRQLSIGPRRHGSRRVRSRMGQAVQNQAAPAEV